MENAPTNQFTPIAIDIKRMLDSVIDLAVPQKTFRYKKYTVVCDDTEPASFLSTYIADSAMIRLTRIDTLRSDSIIANAIHELAHHIETIDKGETGHSEEYYAIQVKLLCAAFDAGYLSPSSVIDSSKNVARANKKLANKISYIPAPKNAISDAFSIRIYNSYDKKDYLRNRQYKYYATDRSWVKAFDAPCDEICELVKEGVHPEQIKITDGKAVLTSLKIPVRIMNAKPIHKANLNALQYIWDNEKKRYEKRVFPEQLSEELSSLNTAFAMIHYSGKEKLELEISGDHVRILTNAPGAVVYFNHKTKTDEVLSFRKYVKKMFL